MKTTQKQQIRLLEDVIRKQVRSAIKESVIKEASGGPGYSSREAKNIIENSIDDYAKILRKAQYKVIKDWMSKAKGGVLDYFDIMRGIKTNSVQRTHPYEAEFLVNVLRKDKIIDRFRSYFGGKKAKDRRLQRKDLR